MPQYRFFMKRIFPHKDRLEDFAVVQENMGQRKPLFCFQHILRILRKVCSMYLKRSIVWNEAFLTLEKFAPFKQKYLRYNNSPFMNKVLRKVIVTRSKLKRRYNLDRTNINFEKYKKLRNLCVDRLRKSKKQYFNNIDPKNITNNKKFWKTIRPKFSNKS